MEWLRRLHVAVWGAATITMLALWGRSYTIQRPDELRLLTPFKNGGISFKSIAGRVTTSVDCGCGWPQWMQLGEPPYGQSAGFGVTPICDWLFITTPHWFLILLCAVATWYLAWPSSRFSLRTLMILIGTVAVMMGSWAALDRATLPPDGIFW